jgi:hypothetical protein
MLEDLATTSPDLRWLLILFVGAVIAAITPTVDSALLTLTSILSQDVIRPRPPFALERLEQVDAHRTACPSPGANGCRRLRSVPAPSSALDSLRCCQ